MPKPAPRTAAISYRLTSVDQARLDEICKQEKKTRPEVTRDAMLWYLDNRERLSEDMRQSELVKLLRNSVNRIAGLIAKGNLDTGTILQIFYSRMGGSEEEKAAAFKKARKQSVTRLKMKLQEEAELAELYKKDMVPPEEAQELAP
ncbi:MAG TPA: hypothetical protein V6C86_22080 [Oculatellaceae cyanobacterium]